MARIVARAPVGPPPGVTRGRLYGLCARLVQALHESCTEEELERYAPILQECLGAGVPIDDVRDVDDRDDGRVLRFPVERG